MGPSSSNPNEFPAAASPIGEHRNFNYYAGVLVIWLVVAWLYWFFRTPGDSISELLAYLYGLLGLCAGWLIARPVSIALRIVCAFCWLLPTTAWLVLVWTAQHKLSYVAADLGYGVVMLACGTLLSVSAAQQTQLLLGRFVALVAVGAITAALVGGVGYGATFGGILGIVMGFGRLRPDAPTSGF